MKWQKSTIHYKKETFTHNNVLWQLIKTFLFTFILITCFCLYLIIMTIVAKINGNASEWYHTPIALAFFLRFSLINKILAIILSCIFCVSIYRFRKKLVQYENFNEIKSIKNNAILTVIFSVVAILSLTLFINLMIVFINQNYYYIKRIHNLLIPIRIDEIKILEYSYIYLLRYGFYILLTVFIAKFIHDKRSMIKVLSLYLFINFILMIIGTSFTFLEHTNFYNGMLTYWTTFSCALLYPEIINDNFQWISSFNYNLKNTIYENNFIAYLPYFCSFIILIILIKKVSWKSITISSNSYQDHFESKYLFKLS
ncbi:hypothetical protein [Ureaplasma urealyticum]|uniref:hypothetical protein n=1 Tax=Ureaplasma urealyticum TaxID=2130 RepID=UPI0029076B3B|nr:hypothetical protein [Ureaplasma urealyticum]